MKTKLISREKSYLPNSWNNLWKYFNILHFKFGKAKKYLYLSVLNISAQLWINSDWAINLLFFFYVEIFLKYFSTQDEFWEILYIFFYSRYTQVKLSQNLSFVFCHKNT